MDINRTLAALSPGESARIINIAGDCAASRRLRELGFINGETVSCAFLSAHGETAAFVTRGGVFALRVEDRKTVII